MVDCLSIMIVAPYLSHLLVYQRLEVAALIFRSVNERGDTCEPGITMGFVIMLITVYLNTASSGLFTFELFWQVLLASGIAVFAISDIMLANNLCDADEDQLLNRKTLVYYLGKKGGLRLFVINYVLGYGCLILSVGLHYLPYTSLLVLLSLPLVVKNTRQFLAKQVKKETFKFAVKNAMILAVFCIVCIGVGTIANW